MALPYKVRAWKELNERISGFFLFSYSPLFSIGAEGKPIPTELRQEANALNEEIQLEDELTARKYLC